MNASQRACFPQLTSGLSMPQEILSKKRPSEEEISDGNPAIKRRAVGDSKPASQIQFPTVEWSNKFGSTCLFGIVGTSQSDGRVALFDLDQTLIDTKSGSKFPRDHEDWRWLSSKVPAKLKQLHAEGYTLFITSNQAHPRKVTKPEVYFAEWRNKIEQVAHALQSVPFRILAATDQDEYRKPLPGMWHAITSILKAEGVTVNQETAFYVGDAAGRNGRKRDYSASDRKFALNVGIQFHTPQEYFLGEAPLPFQLSGFHPSNILDRPHYLPTQFPLVLPTKNGPGIVLFVGYPAMGKTTTYNKYFKPAGYVYVDRKTFQTESNCMKAMEDSIKAGKSVVVDGTNYDASTREDYLRIGADLKVAVRCIVFDGGEGLAWHNHVYRKYILKETVNATQPQNEREFKKFGHAYQRPTAAEGFKHKIITIFWKFEGTEEEHRKYMMWLDF